jgi:hypothetical protein
MNASMAPSVTRVPQCTPQSQQAGTFIAIAEARHWLELNMLIMPAPCTNGRNGWKVLTWRGTELVDSPDKFRTYAAAAEFPKSLIPTIPGELFAKFQTSYDSDPVDAVFKALGVD